MATTTKKAAPLKKNGRFSPKTKAVKALKQGGVNILALSENDLGDADIVAKIYAAGMFNSLSPKAIEAAEDTDFFEQIEVINTYFENLEKKSRTN